MLTKNTIFESENKSTTAAMNSRELFRSTENGYFNRNISHNLVKKQFMFLNYTVYVSPGENFESAELRAPRALLLYVPHTLRALVLYVFSCLTCLVPVP